MGIIEVKSFLKTIGPPSYYLRNEYNFSEEEKAWVVGFSTYSKEAVRKVEGHPVIGGKLYPHRTPLPADCRPEISSSELLDDKMTKIYQMLIGLMQWKSVISYSTSVLLFQHSVDFLLTRVKITPLWLFT